MPRIKKPDIKKDLAEIAKAIEAAGLNPALIQIAERSLRTALKDKDYVLYGRILEERYNIIDESVAYYANQHD